MMHRTMTGVRMTIITGKLMWGAITLVILGLAGCGGGTDGDPQAAQSSASPAAEVTELPPSPGTGDGQEDDQAPSQPLDGGTFTWASGVSMRLMIEKVEPWGTLDDYCGDGSCGVSQPDDTRLVLKYEITVPEDFDGSFDASACPGTLHVMNGNDEEAVISVAGEYYRSLEDIRPGATKYGVAEYSIARDSSGEVFYIESSCGDLSALTLDDWSSMTPEEQAEAMANFTTAAEEYEVVVFEGQLPK
jgi:hypothetical protein